MTTVADMIIDVDAILLDFDGPICSVFAGYPAPQVADDLRLFLGTIGILDTDAIGAATDPLEILRWVAATYPSAALDVDGVLCAAERNAVATASPTAHAHDAIVAARRTGRLVAIVSNNSEPAIGDYLARYSLASQVAFVAGRAHGAPELMKPHPDSVQRALGRLGVPASACVFVGDSVTDVAVSRLTGVRPVGYAETPDRRADLVRAGAEVVIATMRELVVALDAG
ncbi:MAG: HAD family hydrolase [Labedaea sp.]